MGILPRMSLGEQEKRDQTLKLSTAKRRPIMTLFYTVLRLNSYGVCLRSVANISGLGCVQDVRIFELLRTFLNAYLSIYLKMYFKVIKKLFKMEY